MTGKTGIITTNFPIFPVMHKLITRLPRGSCIIITIYANLYNLLDNLTESGRFFSIFGIHYNFIFEINRDKTFSTFLDFTKTKQ